MDINNFINKVCIEDSFKLLPSLPDQSIDLVLTDPPYNFCPEHKMYLQSEFLRVSRNGVIVFSPPENQWILPAEQYGFWIKPISTKNTSRKYSRFVEMIFFYNMRVWNNNRHWSQYTNVFTDLVDNAKLHPFRKPPSLIERLILNHTNEGDVILDPFAGSRVVFDVANKLGRKCISFEISQDFFTTS